MAILRTRYREERTLVRPLRRPTGSDRNRFKENGVRLRRHFEQFNIDVAELCQWFMGLRPGGKRAGTQAEPFWKFFLEPPGEEDGRDRRRLAVFGVAAGSEGNEILEGMHLEPATVDSIRYVASVEQTPTTRRLFERLRTLSGSHQQVLLKAAAEWVVARYQRGYENWQRQREEWEKEKEAWEAQRPELTEAVRKLFTGVFKSLKDPQEDGSGSVQRKNPRVCLYEWLKENIDNCIYAGEKGHGPLCWKYVAFVRARKERNSRFNDKKFAEDAEKYITMRSRTRTRDEALRSLFPLNRRDGQLAQQRFRDNWGAYLQAMGLQEQTVLQHGRLPHCLKIGGKVYEKSECRWNPHTMLCEQYRRVLVNPGNGLDAATLALEPSYREWRKLYLAGPGKPQFRYPSSRDLPMPKIFGKGYFEVDFARSVLKLRMDDMGEGQFLEFGFRPWPADYDRQPADIAISSVHVHFVGHRARAGFRFDVPHKPSRFGCSQDELDELRSRRFPRQAQDQAFLEAARGRLRETFCGDAERDLRLLAVDLGMTGASGAFYEGKKHREDIAFPIVKIDRLYEDKDVPEPFKGTKETPDRRGLRKEHVGRHLKAIGEGAVKIAEHRANATAGAATLKAHDFRVLKRHIAWMIRDWARLNAARIIAAAEKRRCDLIVFESLRGNRLPGYEQLGADAERQKAERVLYAYGRVRRKVAEKAVERGMRIVTVPDFKSSRVCSACGREQKNHGLLTKNKAKRLFICEYSNCKKQINSDANAARVLARVFWGEIELPRQ